MSNGGSGTSKNAQALTPQQLALLQGIAGTAPVRRAQATCPASKGCLVRVQLQPSSSNGR